MCVECFKAGWSERRAASTASTDRAINYAAGRLPDGWVISIEIEKGWAGLVLFDDFGEERLKSDFDKDCTLSERIVEMVDKACGLAFSAT